MPVQGEFFQNPGSSGGFYDYQIEQSARFDRDDQSYLTQDFGNLTAVKWTVSVWLKRAETGYDYSAIVGRTGGGSQLYFTSADKLEHYTHAQMLTDAVFRDTTGWYHIVWNQATAQLAYCWVNGVAKTVNVSGTASPWLIPWNTDSTVGNVNGTSNVRFFDGYMAELYGIYNQDLNQNDFGEFKNGVWKPIDASSGITFGSNDYYLKFEDASNLGNDSSGNNNDWTVNNMGPDHQVIDSPTFGS